VRWDLAIHNALCFDRLMAMLLLPPYPETTFDALADDGGIVTV
jgi:hypothetical protein